MKWIFIPKTDNKYILYDNGEVFSIIGNKFLKKTKDKRVKVYINGKSTKIPLISMVYKTFGKFIGQVHGLNAKDLKKSKDRIKSYNKDYNYKRYYLDINKSRKEAREKHRYNIKILSDSYIRRLIVLNFQLNNGDVNKELIELKRKQICLNRRLKQKITQE